MRVRRFALVIASAALLIAASSPLQMPADGPSQNSSVRQLLLAAAPGLPGGDMEDAQRRSRGRSSGPRGYEGPVRSGAPR